jgi:hypothetical protein
MNYMLLPATELKERLLKYGFPMNFLVHYAKSQIRQQEGEGSFDISKVVYDFFYENKRDFRVAKPLSTLLMFVEKSHDPKLIIWEDTPYVETDTLIRVLKLPVSSLFLTTKHIPELLYKSVHDFKRIRRNFLLKAERRPPSRKDVWRSDAHSVFIPKNIYLQVRKHAFDFYLDMLNIPEDARPSYQQLGEHLLDFFPVLTSYLDPKYCRMADFKKRLFVSVNYIAKTYILPEALDRFIHYVNVLRETDPGIKYPEYVAFAQDGIEYRRGRSIESPLRKPPPGLEGKYVLYPTVYLSVKCLAYLYETRPEIFRPMLYYGWKREGVAEDEFDPEKKRATKKEEEKLCP